MTSSTYYTPIIKILDDKVLTMECTLPFSTIFSSLYVKLNIAVIGVAFT